MKITKIEILQHTHYSKHATLKQSKQHKKLKYSGYPLLFYIIFTEISMDQMSVQLPMQFVHLSLQEKIYDLG